MWLHSVSNCVQEKLNWLLTEKRIHFKMLMVMCNSWPVVHLPSVVNTFSVILN